MNKKNKLICSTILLTLLVGCKPNVSSFNSLSSSNTSISSSSTISSSSPKKRTFEEM